MGFTNRSVWVHEAAHAVVSWRVGIVVFKSEGQSPVTADFDHQAAVTYNATRIDEHVTLKGCSGERRGFA